MLFNTIEFLVFFQMTLAAYFALPHKARWALLLLASCYFYMAFVPRYIFVLFFLILIDYCAGILIEGSQGAKRKWILIISLVANVGMLGFFKYTNFLSMNLVRLAHYFGWQLNFYGLNIILPIGLSFHTLQSMSYTIEVYLGNQKAEKHLGIYALYVLFFPQMVAGPIERPQHLLHQLREEKKFEYQRVVDGLKLMLWGLFKKAVIADQLSRLVDPVYDHPLNYAGWPLILATYAFSFQIFCDFSGYSDIAVGAAQVMGIDLMRNFKAPFHAKSIPEFWNRWHISLSTWFRDYLYIPLSLHGAGYARLCLNVFFVFLISGLWHGARWTFIVFGALHGSYMLFSIWTSRLRKKVTSFLGLEKWPAFHQGLRIFITFHLVVFAFIFFRAQSISNSLYIIKHLFVFKETHLDFLQKINPADLMTPIFAILIMEVIHWGQGHWRIRESLSRVFWPLRCSFYVGAVLVVLAFGRFASQTFIYFQF